MENTNESIGELNRRFMEKVNEVHMDEAGVLLNTRANACPFSPHRVFCSVGCMAFQWTSPSRDTMRCALISGLDRPVRFVKEEEGE